MSRISASLVYASLGLLTLPRSLEKRSLRKFVGRLSDAAVDEGTGNVDTAVDEGVGSVDATIDKCAGKP